MTEYDQANRPEPSAPEPSVPDLRVNVVGTTSGSDDTDKRLLVLLHGYGADENDLAPLARFIDPGEVYFTICPRGPFDVPPFGAGWYDRGADGAIDPAVFVAAVDAVDRTIDATCAQHGFDRGRSVVIGFSQGGAMTLAATLRASGAVRPAAVACLSGMLTEVDGLEYDFGAADLPRVMIQHGTLDPVVTPERGRRTRDMLESHSVAHTYLEYPMQHEIVAESIADLRDWLAAD